MSVPSTFSALSFVGAYDTTATNELYCPFGGPTDAQILTSDEFCMNAIGNPSGTTCTIAGTTSAEWVVYKFTTTGPQNRINLSFRLASASPNRRIQVQIYPELMGPTKIISGPGLGFQNYTTVAWENVPIIASSSHLLKVTFLDGKVNLCALTVEFAS